MQKTPLLSLLPPIFQQTQFGIPTRQRREPKRPARFELATTSRFGVRLRLAGPFLPLRSVSESEEIHGIPFPDSRIQRDDNRAPVSLQINVEEAILLIAMAFIPWDRDRQAPQLCAACIVPSIS